MLGVRNSAVILAVVTVAPLFTAESPSPFSGRWDLTIITSKGAYPAWMEFADQAGTPAVRMVGRTGSVHPVKNAQVDQTHLTFADGASQAMWQLTVQDRKITGQAPDGQLIGVPAPALKNPAPSAWSNPAPLFDGRDLSGWLPDNPATNYWTAANGELQNAQAGANIRTTRTFGDFKLHIEYNCPAGGNSGVYLRGRYEVQVEYEPAGKNDSFHSMGSIYGFIPPATALDPRPGQWESYDVTLVGRTVTVVRDGVHIIDNAEIPGITGGAFDSRESEPGPIYLQGDHTGGLKYRNITISVPPHMVQIRR
jgi:Domain of Unknown Function (DUF1080)